MPNIKKNIFNRKKLNYLLSRLTETSIPDLNAKLEIIGNWKNFIHSGNIYDTKETALQGNFLTDIFSGVLGYKSRIKNYDEWNLNQEQTTAIDGKSADGSLGFFYKDKEDVRAVIELKDANTNLDERQHRHNDTRTPVEQAFSYQHKTGKSCKWVIVSNFREIRLYHSSSSTEYEVFFIEELDNFDTFKRFYFLLNCSNLISKIGASEIDSLYATNEAEEQNISKEFYSAFKQARLKLFDHIKANNPDKPELLVLEKTQKLLDRFIFICFCEDNRLLPDKTYRRIVETANKSFSFNDTKIWNELKGLFHAINIGSPQHGINKFNGGLFAEDSELDSLIIKDGALAELQPITDYDFESDVDVNILGHIFEQSISDIEEIKSGIEGKDYDKKTSKRKKDGIYYTPEYITKYIVENAVGGWLEDRKKELGFYELPELSESDLQTVKIVKGKTTFSENIRKHFDFWTAYKEKLMNIKVIDPACGSGAFLNQAFNFLFAEGQKVNDTLARLTLGQGVLFEHDKHILSNNLYGVDLNNESVEITRLSLWLKTANKQSKLTALDKNIKCGNSLIDDPAVAGDKAFDWNKEFPEIMQSGGFDVVIGNPPYGAELSSIEQGYLNAKFTIGSTDTAILFIKKAKQNIKDVGHIGFIIPKAFSYSSNYEKIRGYVWENLTELVDCRKVWKEVLLEQVIVFFNNRNNVEYRLGILRDRNIEIIGKIHKDIAKKYGFFVNGISVKEINIADKIVNNSLSLNDIAINRRGAMLQKYISDGIGVIAPVKVIGGAEIARFGINGAKGKISRNQIESDQALINNNSVLVQNIVAHIENPTDHILITACLPENKDNAIVDTINQITVKDQYSNKYVWCILNSKLMNWFAYRFIYGKAIRTMHFDNAVTSRIPIKMLTHEKQKDFVSYADNIITAYTQCQKEEKEFIAFLINKFNFDKISVRLQNWHGLSYNEFLSELTKAKAKLPLDEQLAWQSLFENQKAKVLELKFKIAETDRMIDSMVYELYGLTEEEIRIIEGV